MADIIYYVFLISKGITGHTRPQQIFMAKNISEAKLYFEGYILDNERANDYKLFRIAEMDNRMRVKENYAFITGGYEIKAIKENKKKSYNQIKLEFEKEQEIKKNEKEKTKAEIVKELFEGKFIYG